MSERFLTLQCKDCARWNECDYYDDLENVEDAMIKAELVGTVKGIWWMLECIDREEDNGTGSD